MQFVSFLCRTSKGSGPCAMTHCNENTLFPIEENQICNSVCSFLFTSSIPSIRPWAVAVNGRISRGKSSNAGGPSWRTGRQLINKWHHLPPRRLSACHIGGKRKDKKEGKEKCLFLPLGLQPETLRTVCLCLACTVQLLTTNTHRPTLS